MIGPVRYVLREGELTITRRSTPWGPSDRTYRSVRPACAGAACAYGIALGLIIVIRAVRSASATAISFAASFAVLRFEPHTTMPPNNADAAAAIIPRSNR